jgi:hypothetical protein
LKADVDVFVSSKEGIEATDGGQCLGVVQCDAADRINIGNRGRFGVIEPSFDTDRLRMGLEVVYRAR